MGSAPCPVLVIEYGTTLLIVRKTQTLFKGAVLPSPAPTKSARLVYHTRQTINSFFLLAYLLTYLLLIMVLVNKFIDLNSACLCLCMTGGLGSGVDGRRNSGVFKGGALGDGPPKTFWRLNVFSKGA